MAYQCPLCHQPLALNERTFQCADNHQFDVAKEGYVNLMPAHHKRSKDPGDNKEMTMARREFLGSGYYDTLRDNVAKLIASYYQESAATLLDIGCGEGYYTHAVANALNENNEQSQAFGLDISKVAVRFAAKRYRNCQFSVASSHRLPFNDQSLDAVLRIYAPCKHEELQRCIKSGGRLFTVTPASRHLYQLRERIYNDVRLHSENPEEIDGFQLEREIPLNYDMDLLNGDGFNLLQMTPFAWKASEELKSELKSLEHFSCEADFMIRIYRKS
ncbi:23S rRNA (guanine(745)-N(1))-methyltransferase [Vibrio mexicanus]|uniref:23S rRNA (guanine(745)-N(1))-methyltransferase n=1 Tax=Vibrio mexicanus TaxID=1004326 RepID=UPI00063CD249|nr:23S rRNA (guanine(745)-N(1))-methyltransferase [Vibrio mexicanus]